MATDRRNIMADLVGLGAVEWKCTICGAKGSAGKVPACGCWVQCACGWSYEKGETCRNPVHRAAKGRR